MEGKRKIERVAKQKRGNKREVRPVLYFRKNEKNDKTRIKVRILCLSVPYLLQLF
jgi:hypothetical protein